MKFTISKQADLQPLKEHLDRFIFKKKKAVVDVKEYDNNVTTQQHRYYWGTIIENAILYGRENKPEICGTWNKNQWDDFLRMEYFSRKFTSPWGEEKTVPKRLAFGFANRYEVASYFTKVISEFAQLGWNIPSPDDAWWEDVIKEVSGKGVEKDPDEGRIRDQKYLQHIRSQHCLFCGSPHDIHAHHIRWGTDGGTGLKPSDCYCIPLCYRCHDDVHKKGEVDTYMKYSVWGNEHPKSFAYKLYQEYKKTP